MSEMVKVAVDAMGGDNAPSEIIKGALEAANGRSTPFSRPTITWPPTNVAPVLPADT